MINESCWDGLAEMEKFKVAAVQMNALKGDLKHNLEVHRRIVTEAAADGCRLVMFPELSITAHYGDESVVSLAEEAAHGTIHEAMWELAKKLSIHVAYGFCEIAHGTYYNSHAIMSPRGLVGVQRKVHASKDEYFSFRMGRTFEVFDIGFCRVGTLICYDSVFFEAWRVLALKDADVILLPHASRLGWGRDLSQRKKISSLKRNLRGLPRKYGVFAADNCVFAVYGNQVDFNGHSTHHGGACIIAPDGKLIRKSEPVLDDLWISAELDPETQAKARANTWSTLKMRRPETYSELTKML